MTNYDMTMDMLAASTFHPDSVEQARKYLRDLKASHEGLRRALRDQHKMSSCQCPWCLASESALKAAEVLR